MGEKTGPKTDNPKNIKLSVKLDEKSSEILERYKEEKNVSSSETVRRGLYLLEDDLKK